MVFTAFIDESYGDEGTVVLAGHVASAENWVRFTEQWQQLLRTHGVLSPNKDVYRFKMSEMAQLPERMRRVPAFFRVIEEFAPLSISVRVNQREIERLASRLFIPYVPINWGEFKNPYVIALYCLLDMFHTNREKFTEFIPLDEKVDFIFDDRPEKRKIIAGWDDYIRQRPAEIRDRFGATPRFEDDDDFLPLQAADFWAWWVRKWYVAGEKTERLESGDFGEWKVSRNKNRLVVDISFDEDQLARDMKANLRKLIPPGVPIYDVRYRFGD